MYKSVFSKYLSIISAVVIVGFLAMTLLQVIFTTTALAGEKKELLMENAQSIAHHTALSATATPTRDHRVVYHLNEERLSPILNMLSEAIDATVLVVNGEGRILLVSGEGLPSSVMGDTTLAEILPKIRESYYEVGTLNGLYDTRQYTAAVPVLINDRVALGYVFASAPADILAQTLHANLRIYLMSVLGALLLSLIFVWVMTYRFVRPLREMAAATRSFARGDFSTRVKVVGKDEVAELAEALNSMAVSLSSVESMRRSFIANVSHELKTPMTTIAGFVDSMLDGTVPREKQAHYMRIVSDEVKRLSRMVRSMLDLSRIDSGELKMNTRRLDLTEAMCSVLVASEQRIEQKRLTVTGIEDCQRMEVEGDYDLLSQVLYNLLDNAIKFTNERGQIDIRLYRAGERVYTAIRNTGDGIPASEMPQIFERFYKSDRSRSLDKNGVGLGLYIVQTVVRLHGGEITVRSVEGEFTEFCFWLPAPPGRLPDTVQ
ncbi:MAG: HAMP domain-containing histidine kinase [Clostridia bacterium]|nr:HAMP domain-containing histidine kinase [Clostridia bacterium]